MAIPTDTMLTIPPFEIRPDVTNSTCPARMCKSGSAIEIKKPRINPPTTTTHTLFVFAIVDPMMLPMGVIPISTPNKKIDNPTIISAAPIRNRVINGASNGVKVKFKIKTMIVIGRTAYNTSFTLDTNSFNDNSSFLVKYGFVC